MRFELIPVQAPPTPTVAVAHRRQHNGQVLAYSEAYSNRADAVAAIETVRDNAYAAPTRSTP